MWVVLFVLFPLINAQFSSQTYPDPRLDPISCRLAFPSPVCDPSAIVTDEERAGLVRKLSQLRSVTANIRNTAAACALQPDRNMDIYIAIIDKIGNIPGAPVDIEKFANNLKRRYQNFQDVGVCDTTVLIVNSRQDRQVYTVAGRDARISKDTLKSAFERNIVHFKTGRYALGLEGMVEIIVSAYTNAHLVQTASPEGVTASLGQGIVTNETPFRVAGLPNSVQPVKPSFVPLPATNEIDEKDQVWISIMQQAMARCGQDSGNIAVHVRAVIEEAMAISTKLISDSRYNSIEEEVEAHRDVIGIRDRAWETAKGEFIAPLFAKYRSTITSGSTTCPAIQPTSLKRH